MIVDPPPRWFTRPAVVAAGAFVVGAVIAGVVVAFVLTRDDDSDTNGGPAPATATASTGTPPATAVATPLGSGTPLNPRRADDALAAYVQEQLNQPYVGACPQDSSGGVPQGICSIELYRSAELVTFTVGPPFSEVIGEAVLTPGENGVWAVDFVGSTGRPPAVGGRAVVFGAGDCLTFRGSPSRTGEALSCQIDGAAGEVIGGPQIADGITWWQVRDLGWASGEFLQLAP